MAVSKSKGNSNAAVSKNKTPKKTAKATDKNSMESQSPRDIKKPVVPRKKAPVVSADESKSPAQKRKKQTQISGHTPAKKGKQEHMVYVNRLSKSISEQSLTTALSGFGNVIDIDIIRSGPRKNKVFAFVSFGSATDLEKAVSAKTVTIGNKTSFINKKNSEEVHRVKVSKCPKGTTEKMIKEKFSAYGTVLRCKKLSFGFSVGLDSSEAKATALKATEVEVNGGAVTVESDEFDPSSVRHAYETKKELKKRKAAAKAAAAEAEESMEVEDGSEGEEQDGQSDDQSDQGFSDYV